MSKQYRIEWQVPSDYDPSAVLSSLPSPISREMTEIYNYAVKDYGFLFLDNDVNQQVTGYAMKLFVDEALRHVDEVTIREL